MFIGVFDLGEVNFGKSLVIINFYVEFGIIFCKSDFNFGKLVIINSTKDGMIELRAFIIIEGRFNFFDHGLGAKVTGGYFELSDFGLHGINKRANRF